MTEELRNSLKRLDPMQAAVSTELPTTESSRHRMERVMSTTTHLTTPPSGVRTPKRWVPALATLVVAAIAVSVFTFGGAGTDPAPVAGPPLELSLGDSNVLASCIIFDVAILRDMPIAFEGTVTGVDGARGTLTVDHWYKGGAAAEVALTGGSADMVSLIGAFPLEVGSSYLIAATDGNVNFCGYSGPASPELRGYFEEAFGA
ncbi:MAG: hypothetical protein JJE47_11070 [Acidimicrobiia bacterium]|nr:hypothetical protein [Acidimicrobiia bacterium]